MTTELVRPCPWTERVSAMIDDELPTVEMALVERHVMSCGACAVLVQGDRSMVFMETSEDPIVPTLIDGLIPTPTRTMRLVLAMVGILIVTWSVPSYVRGNTNGDVLHDLRHLAIWQVAVGVAFLSGAMSFRFSRIVGTMSATFLLLTTLAAIYDIATGHRGPWSDPTHVIEVIAVALILRMSWPYLTLSPRRAS